MEDEKKPDMQEAPVTTDDDNVTDEQLAKAYRAISGEEEVKPVVEEKKEDPAPVVEEPVKLVEEPVVSPELKQFQDRIATLEAELAATRKLETPAEPTEEEEQFLTNKNVDEVLEQREQKRAKAYADANSTYQRSYEIGLATLARGVDKDTFQEIFQEMISNNGQNPFNVKNGDGKNPATWNADFDVRVNFANAKAKVYENRVGKVRPNLSPEPNTLPTGITINNRETVAPKETPQLDEHAMAVLKGSGLSDDEIKEALGGPATFYQRQSR